ncbi:acyltransferase family protein [Rhizobium leguminosarum]|uniref:acyltransferase family protein n=1 Tax=Rhizobium leguminosarum TaxID=384 RepID=UPI002F92225C
MDAGGVEKPFYPNFNMIRLVAASMVIFSHAFLISEKTEANEPFVRLLGEGKLLGIFGVYVFFITSGFLVTQSAQFGSVGGFLWRRALRISACLHRDFTDHTPADPRPVGRHLLRDLSLWLASGAGDEPCPRPIQHVVGGLRPFFADKLVARLAFMASAGKACAAVEANFILPGTACQSVKLTSTHTPERFQSGALDQKVLPVTFDRVAVDDGQRCADEESSNHRDIYSFVVMVGSPLGMLACSQPPRSALRRSRSSMAWGCHLDQAELVSKIIALVD